VNNFVVMEVTVGDVIEVTATAKLSNGEEVDYSDKLNPYNSSNNNVVLMNKNIITAVNAGMAVIKFNSDDFLADKHIVINVKAAPVSAPGDEEEPVNPGRDDEDDDVNPGRDDEEDDVNPGRDDEEDDVNPGRDDEVWATLIKVEWSVDSLELNEGETTIVKLIGTYSDGSTKDMTNEYELYPSKEDIVEIGSNGKITAVGEGETKLNFKSKAMEVEGYTIPRPMKIVVKPASRNEIVALEWSAEAIELSVDEIKTIKLYAVYGDGSKEDMTEECGVYAMDEDIAVMNGTQLKGIGEGKTELWFESVPKVGIDLPELLNVTVD